MQGSLTRADGLDLLDPMTDQALITRIDLINHTSICSILIRLNQEKGAQI